MKALFRSGRLPCHCCVNWRSQRDLWEGLSWCACLQLLPLSCGVLIAWKQPSTTVCTCTHRCDAFSAAMDGWDRSAATSARQSLQVVAAAVVLNDEGKKMDNIGAPMLCRSWSALASCSIGCSQSGGQAHGKKHLGEGRLCSAQSVWALLAPWHPSFLCTVSFASCSTPCLLSLLQRRTSSGWWGSACQPSRQAAPRRACCAYVCGCAGRALRCSLHAAKRRRFAPGARSRFARGAALRTGHHWVTVSEAGPARVPSPSPYSHVRCRCPSLCLSPTSCPRGKAVQRGLPLTARSCHTTAPASHQACSVLSRARARAATAATSSL